LGQISSLSLPFSAHVVPSKWICGVGHSGVEDPAAFRDPKVLDANDIAGQRLGLHRFFANRFEACVVYSVEGSL
jgi:hypothetical protein